MRFIVVGLSFLAVAGCTSPAWVWQDPREPSRTSPEADLAACRSHASAQYRPGIPAGDPYLRGQNAGAAGDAPAGTGTWHPDREPFPSISRSQEALHGVAVPYTGYPGYLDYHPGFLDALVEKCMADRGWVFQPAPVVPQ